MDRLIWTAWRAFWIGLGASAVIVGQSLVAPAAPAASEMAPSVESVDGPSAPEVVPVRVQVDNAPALSRNAAPKSSKSRVRHAS